MRFKDCRGFKRCYEQVITGEGLSNLLSGTGDGEQLLNNNPGLNTLIITHFYWSAVGLNVLGRNWWCCSEPQP